MATSGTMLEGSEQAEGAAIKAMSLEVLTYFAKTCDPRVMAALQAICKEILLYLQTQQGWNHSRK